MPANPETMSLDAKLSLLFAYRATLFAPHPDAGPATLAPPAEAFHSSSTRNNVRQHLDAARRDIAIDIGNLGRSAYSGEKFPTQDMRADTLERRAARCSILAVVTQPLSHQERHNRRVQIGDILGSLLEGTPIAKLGLPRVTRGVNRHVESLDTDSPVFGRFESHVSYRTLHFQYENTRDDYLRPTVSAPVLSLDLMGVFSWLDSQATVV